MLVSNRSTNILLVIMIAIGIGIVAMLATGARGGPLDPAGAPASTPGGIDGRIPISSLPFTISQSGSYYMTKNLTGDGAHDGITIAISNVTIDLNGVTLSGTGQTHSGIHTAVPVTAFSGISIAHGIVSNWQAGILLGIDSTGGTISDIEASNNVQGIATARESVVSNCTVHDNLTVGISLNNSRLIGCTIASNGDYGVLVSAPGRSTIERNRIELHALFNVQLDGAGSTVADNDMYNTTAPDIDEVSNDNVIIRNRVSTCSSIVSLAGSYVPIAKISGSASTAVGREDTNIALNPSGAGLC